MRSSSSARSERGFTLIELLIVLGILGLLLAVLLPNVLGASKRGEEAETEARMLFLHTAIEAFERRAGIYPPDNFVDPDNAIKAKPDAINPGIESLVIFLHQKPTGSDTLSSHEDWLTNTDNDQNVAEIPLLHRTDKVEVVDAWGTPIAYFASQTGGYARSQKIKRVEGEEVTVHAVKNPETGKHHMPGKYQLISAGADGEFGTGDDLVYPRLR
jgi:prepilin-type N-terminal cleavage/methylation domain-containing protein